MTGVFVLAALAAGFGADGGPEGAAAQPKEEVACCVPRLSPGDSFVFDVKFSNAWEAARVEFYSPGYGRTGRGELPRPPQPKGRVVAPEGRTSAPRPELRLVPIPIPQVSDPLFAEFKLEGSVAEEKSIFVKLNVSRVHYFDNRGREWTIQPAEEGAKARAAEILKRAASSWREDLSDWPEKEMLEEQVVGAALALLHEAELQLEPAGADGRRLEFRGLSDLLDERLPRSLEKALRSKVAALLSDIARRAFSPVLPEELLARREFERDGVSYRTEGMRRAADSPVRFTSERADDGSGRRLRETLSIDPRTRLVLEGSSIAIRDSLRDRDAWVGFERWSMKLVQFKARRK